MAGSSPDRPVFSQGQYIGAADLNDIVDYARDGQRRLQLSGMAWGIAVGLDLIEIPAAGGSVEMWIEPGVAWDGYGRMILLTSPALVSPDLFASFSSPSATTYPVWLRYSETQPAAGQTAGQCNGSGTTTTTLIQESYVIEAGNFPQFTSQQSGITIGGAAVSDPRDMLRAVNQNAAVVLDSSAPQQTFPTDSGNAFWLVPVGMAAWDGTKFIARSTDQLKQSRAQRRYLGTIAESILAADGVLRLRDRKIDPAGLSDDQLAQQNAIQPYEFAVDQNTGRCVGHDLVWVEGNMRVTGDARLFGSKLEFRDSKGETEKSPLYVQRGAKANPAGGHDLQVTIGATGDGTDRLTLGYLNQGAFQEKVIVGSDGGVLISGQVGIGPADPPRAPFDLRADIAGDSNDIDSHAAIVENKASTNANALAIQLYTPPKADGKSNFITFFNQNRAIGSIKAAGFTLPSTSPPVSYKVLTPDNTINDPDSIGPANHITLVTNGADFAECLPRQSDAPPIGPGCIVGVFAGHVSLATRGADGLLVTTDRPAVLGNARGSDQTSDVEAVALVGQVAVIIEGAVKSGDFIVPSGRGDGIGRAVAPTEIRSGDLHQIVGRAWESSDAAGLKRINTIVGTANNASLGIATLLTAQSETIRSLADEVARLKRCLGS